MRTTDTDNNMSPDDLRELQEEARQAFIERYTAEHFGALRDTPTYPITPMAIERGDMTPEDNLFYHVVELASCDEQLADLLSRALAKLMNYQPVLANTIPILADAGQALEVALAAHLETLGADAWVDEQARLDELAIAEAEDYDSE